MQLHDRTTHTYYWPRLALCLGALFCALQLGACKDSSVVPDAGTNRQTATPAPAAAMPAASPQASVAVAANPAASPLTGAPVPSGTTTMTTARASVAAVVPTAANDPQPAPSLPPGAKLRRLGDFPMEVGPAKIPTPEPDPFKPRPTPTVVLENGKLKQQWPAPAEVANLSNPVKNRPDAVQTGRTLYLQRCADCHGREGRGNGYLSAQLKREGQPIAPTNLASQMVQANTDGELFWKITNGRSPMPANRARFDDEQRWYIVTYLRTLK